MEQTIADFIDKYGIGLYIPRVHITDIIEVLILTFLIYQIIIWIKNTKAWMLLRGIIVLAGFILLAAVFKMHTILFIARNSLTVMATAAIVVFQPELRRALEKLGEKQFLTSVVPFEQNREIRFSEETREDIIRACFAMGKVKTGALIVVEQAIRLTEYESTGIQMDCLVSSQVLINIFEHNTPLHDGAIIVRGDRIVSATCYLPLSDNMGISKDLGTRHRAAVGMSEVSDALVITVSEETGAVSVAQGGELTRSINEAELRVKLEEVQHKSSETNRIKAMWKGWRSMRKRITNNLALKILAFLIAAFLWLVVVNIDDPVDDKTFSNIPVQVTHEEVITDNNNTYQIVDNTQEINVTVTAQRSVLDKIRAEDIVATANMKELTLRTQVPIEVTVKGYTGKYEKATANPRNLQIQIDEEAKNNFPITPTTTGTVRNGYEVGSLKALPEKVTLRGPKRIINNIAKVTAEANVSGLSEDETVEAKLVLYDANNNVIDQTLLANNLGKEGVSVEVELLQVKSVPLKVDTSEVSAAEGYKLGKITVEPQEVEVTGDKSTLAEISEIDIPPSALKLEELTQRTEQTIDISSYLPSGVSLAEENANKVVISIQVQQPGTKSFEISTGSIILENIADGLSINYGSTVDLEIQVKGPNDVLNLFSPAKKVSIDLKNYTEPGTYTVPVSVELPDGCTLVNEVNVEITLEKSKQSSKIQGESQNSSQTTTDENNQNGQSE